MPSLHHLRLSFLLPLPLIFLLLLSPSMAQSVPGNPQPLDDDLLLPMPGGWVMALRPVCVGGGGYFAWKRFRMGDPSGGYRESPTTIALGGAFRLQEENHTDNWCFYLGKYEVSEGQYRAVTGNDAGSRGEQYPARTISWFDAQDFLHRYNEWLFANAMDKLPRYGGIPGYLRLPTEAEWEFAARGGNRVDAAHFDRKTPYPPGKLPDYEWFSGPSSSHNKVRKIGLLRPNPLGLHDMLGNVAEMTRSLYQVEYYQGRSGGFVARGGHYLTDAKRIRSSMRSEQEFYAFDRRSGRPKPSRKQTLGFRVVLSSLVFPSRQVSQAMKAAWEEYRRGRGNTMPAAVSTSPTATRTRVSGSDAALFLKRLKNQLSRTGVMNDELQQTLNNLGASLGEIQFTVQQAARNSAYAWLKIASEQAFFITREARKLPILDQLIASARQTGRPTILRKYRKRRQEIQANIDQAMSSYVESIRQLGVTGVSALDSGLDRYRRFLKARRADSQLSLLPVVDRHVRSYFKLKRTVDTQWKQELIQWQATRFAPGKEQGKRQRSQGQ